jgi:hypothetical protein
MININTERAKVRYHRKILRMMLILVAIQQREIARVLNRIYADVARNMERNNLSLTLSIEMQKRRLIFLYIRHYKRLARIFSKESFKQLKRLEGKKNVEAEEYKQDATSEFWQAFNTWATTQAASQVSKIQGTTRLLLAQIIAKGRANNLSNQEIAKQIRSIGLISNKKRALRIARTETHTGSVFSQDQVINSQTKRLGIKMEREWSTAKDARVRPSLINPPKSSKFNHRKADGQRRAQKKRFSVSGEKLMYPGDPNGSAGNIINCRCIVLYHTIKKRNRHIELQRRSRNGTYGV